MRNFRKQKGQISRILIILAGAILFITVIVFLAIQIASSRKLKEESQNNISPEENDPPRPVYETTIGDIKFIMKSSVNLGSFVKSNISYQPDLTTTERFIKITIGAQNKGKNQTAQFSWDIGNMVDSGGRNFTEYQKAYYFLPKDNLCGAALKPEFEPVQCVKIFEVSKKSTGLKVEVINKSSKQGSQLLDLDLNY